MGIFVPQLLLLAAAAVAPGTPDVPDVPSRTVTGRPARPQGAIGGIVVNAAHGTPVAGAEVVLMTRLYGTFVPLNKTKADAEGKFVFGPLRTGPYYEYQPGANRDGIYYPGPRVQLTAGRPRAVVMLKVCNAVSRPDPLVIRRQEIVVRPEPGAIHVTETIVVDNPTATCYVGCAPAEGDEPVTLSLAIPPDFEHVTFHQEFFGRRFAVRDGKLVTGIPWTPGTRELTLTYILPCQQAYRLWQRPLDLSCSELRVRVQTDRPGDVSCSLPKVAGADGEVVFQSAAGSLPAGQVIRLELGHLSVPWMTYGKWIALGLLGVLIAGSGASLVWRRRRASRAALPVAIDPPQLHAQDGRAGRRRRRKAPTRRAA